MHTGNRFNTSLIGLLVGALIFTPLLGKSWLPMSRAQDKCATELTKAHNEYLEGQFDEAIVLINKCLSKSILTKVEKKRAYELLAHVYLGKTSREQAEDAIRKLLDLEPKYVPEPGQFKPDYVQLVDEVKMKQPAGGGKKWLLIGGGGAVVAGTVVFLVFKGNSEDGRQRLPNPPALPLRP